MNRTRSFPYAPESVAAARRFATEALADSPSDVLEAVELMVSELATNCIRHAHTAFSLALRHVSGRLRVEVTDRAGGNPEMRSPGPDDPTGRGLQIVNMLSDDWGVDRTTDERKTVWFTLAVPTAPPTCEAGALAS
jgi:anti-sigma regulatory factor (Ser/Thr protein kinase)